MAKFGIFTVMLPGYRPDEAAQLVAEAGFDGIEWRVKEVPTADRTKSPDFWDNNLATMPPSRGMGRNAREIASRYELQMPGIGTYVEIGDFGMLEKALDFAEGAGVGQLRISTGRWRDGLDYEQELASAHAFWNEAVPLARARSIRLLGETHHATLTPSIGLMIRFIQHYAAEDVGIIYDPGNMVWEGYEHYDIGLALAGPYLAHVHVKNARHYRQDSGLWQPDWAPLDDGAFDLAKFFRALKRHGYDGWICLEDFSNPSVSLEVLTALNLLLRETWNAANCAK